MKTYLDDGAYLEVDPYGAVIVSTERENGLNWVALEPEAFRRMVQMVEREYAARQAVRRAPPPDATQSDEYSSEEEARRDHKDVS